MPRIGDDADLRLAAGAREGGRSLARARVPLAVEDEHRAREARQSRPEVTARQLTEGHAERLWIDTGGDLRLGHSSMAR